MTPSCPARLAVWRAGPDQTRSCAFVNRWRRIRHSNLVPAGTAAEFRLRYLGMTMMMAPP